MLGMLNLSAASGLFYAGWWPIDDWMSFNLILHTPFMPAGNMDQMAKIFGAAPSKVNRPPREDTSPEISETTSILKRTPWKIDIGGGMRKGIWATRAAYGWQALAVLAVGALAVAGGAAVGGAAGGGWRRLGGIAGIASTLALGSWCYYVWTTKGMGFSIADGRYAIGGLAVVGGFAGLAMGGHINGLTRLAGVAVILSSMGTGVGLWLGACCEVVKEEPATLGFMLKAFAIHSVYGWMLIVATLLRK